MEKPRIFEEGFLMKILNGVAVGSVVVLIPGALLNEIFKALLPIFPPAQFVLMATAVGMSMMAFAIGVTVSMQFKFTPIQTLAVALATTIGSGAFTPAEGGGFLFQGSGDIINIALTATIATIMVLYFGGRFKAYTMLVVPTVVLIVAGGLGYAILPYVQMITGAVANVVSSLTELQPYIMSILMAMIFAAMIVSPLSTVGIALAVNLAGVGSGAANIGICAAGFGLAIAGWSSNAPGENIALFVGSPKMQMPNVIKNPKILLPILANAAVSGLIGAIFNQQGTPMSAGFGISGLIGPINAINLAAGGWTFMNILLGVLCFIVIPVVLGFVFRYVFMNVTKTVTPEDYRMNLT